jgi:hypothetical protein
MVGVCCGCIAKPASVQPRKTYNTLVPQLFAGEPIGTDEAIDSSMRRKIQKLQEYVQVNPAKIPKVCAGAAWDVLLLALSCSCVLPALSMGAITCQMLHVQQQVSAS